MPVEPDGYGTSLIRKDDWVRLPEQVPYARLAQLAEATGLNPDWCGFESRSEYERVARSSLGDEKRPPVAWCTSDPPALTCSRYALPF